MKNYIITGVTFDNKRVTPIVCTKTQLQAKISSMSETNEAVVINQRTDKVWTDYLATAYAEGFCEGADGTPEEVMEAWAYLINTKLAFKLQGWFGRQATVFIEMGLISPDGVIDWDEFDNIKTEGLE